MFIIICPFCIYRGLRLLFNYLNSCIKRFATTIKVTAKHAFFSALLAFVRLTNPLNFDTLCIAFL